MVPSSLSRRAWTLFEPVHAIVYFAPEARAQYTAAGLRGGWMGYFASRSAAMGAVSAEVVTAVFHNFQPAMVRRAIPDAWTYSTPARVLEARLAVADSSLRRLWGDDVEAAEVTEAAVIATEVAGRLRSDGPAAVRRARRHRDAGSGPPGSLARVHPAQGAPLRRSRDSTDRS